MTGDYNLNYGPLSRTISDPINSEFDAGGFRTTIGSRLSLGFFLKYLEAILCKNTIP
jgi:hypothetical protein